VRSRPSLTARAVALARLELQRPQTPAGDPAAERRLYAGMRMPARWPISSHLRRLVAARTAFFDRATLTAIDDGVGQIVILAAGYDARAMRFAAPGVRFYELDHPATQQDKRRRLAEIGAPLDNAVHITHDFNRDGLPGALAEHGYSVDRPSLFICEGLLLYLERPVIERLLTEVRSCAAQGSRLALNAREITGTRSPTARARAVPHRLLLTAIGEPRRSVFRPGELDELLSRTGWQTVDTHAIERAGGNSRVLLVLAR
jgi:methyltransferase (TIGR00027 family)